MLERPALAGFGPAVTFLENTVNVTPQLLDADVVFTHDASLSGGRLVVAGLLAEDRVSILTQGNGAGQIGVAGGTVSYGGVAFGTATGGVGTDFTVTFNASAAGAAVDALVQRLAYLNVSDTPTATRNLRLNVVDGAGQVLGGGIGPLSALTGTANPFNGFNVGSFSAPAFVDLDGDGDLDLVSGGYNGTLLAWRSTGTSAAPVFTALSGSANPFNGIVTGFFSTPAFLDLDGDGDLDLVSGQPDGMLLAWRRDGSGAAPVFTALTGTANPFNGVDAGSYSTPTAVDLDGDGDLDLVVGVESGALLTWRNNGAGAVPVFTQLIGSANPFNGFNTGPFSVPAFLDLDGDGDLDLVSGPADGKLLAWRNDGTSAAPIFSPLIGSANPFDGIDVGDWNTPAFADMDGDGDLDLVSGQAGGGLLSWRNTAALAPSVTVTVTAENDPPSVTSGATASFAENGTGIVYQAVATDPDAGAVLTWSLTGTDAALFNISATTGAVSFNTAPNFEAPADAGGNNVYDITLRVSDGTVITTQAVAITVTDVSESFIGSTGADLVFAGFNDTLNGGAGIDTLSYANAGAGVTVSLALTAAQSTGGVGTNTISNFENLTGSGFGDSLIGDGNANTIEGLAGNDTINGGGGFDLVSYATATAGVTVNLATGTATGGAGTDTLTNIEGIIGSAYADSLTGDAATNSFDGRGGGDTLSGGAGWDYYIFNSGDTINEVAEGNINTVYVNFATNYTLGAGIGYAVALPGFAISMIGNVLNNHLNGNELGNQMNGGMGNDTIGGGDGADSITGDQGDDALYGEAGVDSLVGGSGNDFLDGGAGADSMTGSIGDDTYYLDNTSDSVIEILGEGYDQIIATAAVTYVLGAGAEVEIMRLATWLGDFAVSLTGNEFTNYITGGNLADTLNGADGQDFIDGGAGHDSIDGGEGNDFLGGGIGNDTLLGGLGQDWIDGGAGADSMAGGAGSDLYFVDNAGDIITEAASPTDYDVARLSVSWTLTAGAEVEQLRSFGTGLSITGNALDQRIIGDAGINILTGRGGRDLIEGGAGADIFRLATASDSTVSYPGRDWWYDWSQSQGDRIDVSVMQAGQSLIGTSAFTNAAGQIRYQTLGYYSTVFGDLDGNGAADWAVDIAGVAVLTNADFIFV